MTLKQAADKPSNEMIQDNEQQSCHEKGWQNKWQAAVNMATQAQIERDDALRRIELAAKYLTHHHMSRPGIAAIVALLQNKEKP